MTHTPFDDFDPYCLPSLEEVDAEIRAGLTDAPPREDEEKCVRRARLFMHLLHRTDADRKRIVANYEADYGLFAAIRYELGIMKGLALAAGELCEEAGE